MVQPTNKSNARVGGDAVAKVQLDGHGSVGGRVPGQGRGFSGIELIAALGDAEGVLLAPELGRSESSECADGDVDEAHFDDGVGRKDERYQLEEK